MLFHLANLSFILGAATNDKAAQESQLLTLVDVANEIGSLVGLESALFSLLAMIDDYDSDAVHVAAQCVEAVGLPQKSSAKLGSSLVVKSSTDFRTIDETQLELLSNKLTSSWREHLGGGIESMEYGHDNCVGILKTAGMIAGTILGAKIAGKAGAVFGFDAGLRAGEAIGSAVCPRDKPNKTDTPTQPNQPDNPGTSGGGNPDTPGPTPDDDPDPPSPPEDPETDGCYPPDYDFFRTDPYTRLSTDLIRAPLAFGKGLDAYLVKRGANSFAVEHLPLENQLRALEKNIGTITKGSVGGISRPGPGAIGHGTGGGLRLFTKLQPIADLRVGRTPITNRSNVEMPFEITSITTTVVVGQDDQGNDITVEVPTGQSTITCPPSTPYGGKTITCSDEAIPTMIKMLLAIMKAHVGPDPANIDELRNSARSIDERIAALRNGMTTRNGAASH